MEHIDQTVKEERANAYIHFFGGFLVLILSIFIFSKNNSDGIILLSFWNLTAFGVFVSSGFYHLTPSKNKKTKMMLKIFDYIAIYLFVGTSVTTIALYVNPKSVSWNVILIVWISVLIAISFKLFFKDKYPNFHTVIYFVLGFSPIFLGSDFWRFIEGKTLVFLLLSGGCFVGSAPFMKKRFLYSHAVWHAGVILGVFFLFLTLLDLIQIVW